MKKLLVIGGGGHAKVVIDLALRSGAWDVVGVLDDALHLAGGSVLGVPVLGALSDLGDGRESLNHVVIAIGANRARRDLQLRAKSAGFAVATLVHSSAEVADSARLGEGSVVMAGVVINADALVGQGVIVNTGATVDHDCAIGDFSHIAPGVALCGGVTVGAGSLIGVGAAVVPGIVIGAECVVGAGASVIRTVRDGTRVIGVPAREI